MEMSIYMKRFLFVFFVKQKCTSNVAKAAQIRRVHVFHLADKRYVTKISPFRFRNKLNLLQSRQGRKDSQSSIYHKD